MNKHGNCVKTNVTFLFLLFFLRLIQCCIFVKKKKMVCILAVVEVDSNLCACFFLSSPFLVKNKWRIIFIFHSCFEMGKSRFGMSGQDWHLKNSWRELWRALYKGLHILWLVWRWENNWCGIHLVSLQKKQCLYSRGSTMWPQLRHLPTK